MKNTQQIKIDETEIENAEQLKHFEDSATHRVETIFYAKFFEPDFLYKTHLYIGKIRFLPNLMIIDIEEERHGIYESPEKPVSTEFNYKARSPRLFRAGMKAVNFQHYLSVKLSLYL